MGVWGGDVGSLSVMSRSQFWLFSHVIPDSYRTSSDPCFRRLHGGRAPRERTFDLSQIAACLQIPLTFSFSLQGRPRHDGSQSCSRPAFELCYLGKVTTENDIQRRRFFSLHGDPSIKGKPMSLKGSELKEALGKRFRGDWQVQ